MQSKGVTLMARKLSFVSILLSLTAAACGVEEGSQTPRIVAFDAAPRTVPVGGVATLSWTVESTVRVAIEASWPGPGGSGTRVVAVPLENDTVSRGSGVHRPAANTTYTLLAFGADMRIVRSNPVNVTVGAAPPTQAPEIEEFRAEPDEYFPGLDDGVDLVIAARRAETLSLEVLASTGWRGVTSFLVPAGQDYFAARHVVTPASGASYRLTAANLAGTDEAYASVIVHVQTPGIPRIARFAIEPAVVPEGEQATVSWEVTGAARLELIPTVPGFSPTGMSGSLSFVPDFGALGVDRTYTLAAINGALRIERSVTIAVRRPSIVSFTATPNAVAAGGSPVTLRWETSGAVAAELSAVPTHAGIPPAPPVTGSLVVTPVAPTVYTLAALGAQGSRTTQEVRVFVVAPGDLVISEIQFSPVGVTPETNGEWFEVYNASPRVVPLGGFRLAVGASTHTVAGVLSVARAGYFVFGRETDPAANGGAAVHYAYAGLSLPAAATLRIEFDGVTIDSVSYAAGASWTDGNAMSLAPDRLSAAANDNPANWCPASTSYGAAGNFGTPGTANPPCT
ncbi:MAG: lamin tail domain-containing protein [Myxococcota bacterium]|nr:lamin tail domain-containing protein [Myxococcota bacterium]